MLGKRRSERQNKMRKLLVLVMALLLALPIVLATCAGDGECIFGYSAGNGNFPLIETSIGDMSSTPMMRHTAVNINIAVGSCGETFWNKGGIMYSYYPQPTYNQYYDRFVQSGPLGSGHICGSSTTFLPNNIFNFLYAGSVANKCTAVNYDGFEKMFIDNSHVVKQDYFASLGGNIPVTPPTYFPIFKEVPSVANGYLGMEAYYSFPVLINNLLLLASYHATVWDDIQVQCQNVSLKAIAYYNTPYEQETVWSAYGSSFQMVPPDPNFVQGSGNVVKYSTWGYKMDNWFDFNRSGTYSIAIFAKGAVNQTPERVALINFSVTGPQGEADIIVNGTVVNNGSIYGGTTTNGTSYMSNYPANTYPADTDAFNTLIRSLGGNGSLIWFLLMVVMAVVILIIARQAGTYVWLAIAVVEMLMLFLGVYIHIISWLWVVIPIVVFLIWVAGMIKDAFT
jgi:hypothetical protein